MNEKQQERERRFDERFVYKPPAKNSGIIGPDGGEMLFLAPYKIKGTPYEIKSFLQSEINLALAEREKEIEERIEKSFKELDEAEQLYPMAIVSWSKKDRTNWVLSLLNPSVEGEVKK